MYGRNLSIRVFITVGRGYLWVRNHRLRAMNPFRVVSGITMLVLIGTRRKVVTIGIMALSARRVTRILFIVITK